VIFDDDVKSNVVRVEDVDDPIAVVEEVLAPMDAQTLRDIYNLPRFTSTLEFLTMLTLSSGRLLKGGTPDILTSAQHVLTDWNHQKIPYYSTPRAIHHSSVPSTAPGAEKVGQSAIVDAFSMSFELDGLDRLDGLFGAAAGDGRKRRRWGWR
jgi:nuclear GTP-binding protein